MFQVGCSPASRPPARKDAATNYLTKPYKRDYTSAPHFLLKNIQHRTSLIATRPSRDLNFPIHSMHYSVVAVVASLALVAQGAILGPRDPPCTSYANQACRTDGEQHCCRSEGHIGEFATCDNAGDLFYIAGCESETAICSQSSRDAVACQG